MVRGGGERQSPSVQAPNKPGRVMVPHPKSDLPIGTVRSILKQAGLL
ncbi:type II toxin-antitoxin system HicA family toxin [Pseudomonas solani]